MLVLFDCTQLEILFAGTRERAVFANLRPDGVHTWYDVCVCITGRARIYLCELARKRHATTQTRRTATKKKRKERRVTTRVTNKTYVYTRVRIRDG